MFAKKMIKRMFKCSKKGALTNVLCVESADRQKTI